MTDCEAGTGEFGSYTRAERDRLIHNLRAIIIDCELYGYGVGAARRDFDELITGEVAAAIGDDKTFCFAECISMAREVAERFKMHGPITIVFDQSSDPEERINAYRSVFGNYRSEESRHPLANLEFLSSTENPGIQAADIWAWEHYRACLDYLDRGRHAPLRPHLQRLAETGRFESNIADRNSIEKFREIIQEELTKRKPPSSRP